ncbi:hypothetical protein [Vreelandella stevensii]|uniref:hypothetical protein n=1 Tax=Vreelandella stevensii TaxID=502821 RepID=UPI003747BC2E
MINDKDDAVNDKTKKESWPLDTLAVLTCGQCRHSWAANGKQVAILKEGQSLACPQCQHEAALDEDQQADLIAHLAFIDKITGKGSGRVMFAGLAAALVGVGSFLGLVPIGVVALVMIPVVWAMISSSSEASKIKPVRLALTHSERPG